MPGRNSLRSSRRASKSQQAIKSQKPKPVKKKPVAQRKSNVASKPTQSPSSPSVIRKPTRSTASSSKRAAILAPPDSNAAASNQQLTSDQVERAAQLAASVFSRSTNENSASSSRLTEQSKGKNDRRPASGSKLGVATSIQLKASNKLSPSLNKKLAKAVKSSIPSNLNVRGAKYYRIKKPLDVKKDSSTNTTEPWIVADPPEQAPFEVCFKDKPAEEDFSEDARRIVANLHDFFTKLGFVDPWKETLNATRIPSKQLFKIRAEMTQVSLDHRY